MSKLIIDELNNDIIIMAKNRANRPIDKDNTQNDIEVTTSYELKCPFCRGNERSIQTEKFKICDKSGWVVKSVNNKFPIINNFKEDIYGDHEVMIDTYRHDGNFFNMSEKEFINLLIMYRNRYIYLMNNEETKYISIFKNFLRKSGASLEHPHTQIISLSIIPPEIENELSISKSYYKKNNRCIYEDLIQKEIDNKKRIINNSEYFLTIIPRASKYSAEIRIIFKNKIRFDEINEDMIKQLAKVLKNMFIKIYNMNGYIPFNLYIHSSPLKEDCSKYFNTHIHIIPRNHNLGGFELSTGMYVTTINPEDLARNLKF